VRYSIVGLGKLGCSMAAAIASRGHHVTGYDNAARVVDCVRGGEAPVEETGLAGLLREHASRIEATHSIADAVHGSDVTFVVVPTPSDSRGAFVLDHAVAAFSALGTALRDKTQPHTVVLSSTVLPGSTRFALIPALEQAAGRSVGRQLGVCYSPAFIALGSVVRDFLNPDLVLVGESDSAAGDTVAAAYAEILSGQPPIRRMTLENAELAKLAVNTFVTTKISFANMLADLCERLPGGDVDIVSDALGLDRRIGRAYLTGALGYGGPCFPRDNQALTFLARALGTAAPLAEATDAVNRTLPIRLAERLRGVAHARGTVAVLGLAYKPATPVLEASQSLQIALALAAGGARVVGHDTLAAPLMREQFADEIEMIDDLQTCIDAADVVLVTSPDAGYAGLQAEHFARGGRRRVVVDFWRVLDAAACAAAGVEYHAIGRGPAAADPAHPLRLLWEQSTEQAQVQTASG
jgi:UDPglucose 6-dehydrogenase